MVVCLTQNQGCLGALTSGVAFTNHSRVTIHLSFENVHPLGGCCISAISCTLVVVVMDQYNTTGIVAMNIPFGAMT